MFGKRRKKELVRVQIVITLDMSKLNEFRNRVFALASPYNSGGDLSVTVATPRSYPRGI
ncbi:hypothetical protein SEA_LYELL_22 [Microbacterium phage Lyell]|nr:hypothetical protein SEA_LYELL_22 [Microbacterium phage Lyell]